MAESSSRSTASGGACGGRAMGGMGSPVPYREGLLAYGASIFCRCKTKAPRWISWSDDNPSRRYYRCSAARTPKDCDFYMWVDDEHTPFMKQLLLDLRDAVWNLKRENAQLKQINREDFVDALKSLRRDNGELMKVKEEMQRANEIKDAILKAKIRELEEKDETLASLATKSTSTFSRCRSIISALVMFGFGLCVGLMLGAM